MTQLPNKWFEVYPHGSKEGDEEARVFRSLARKPKFFWLSTASIVSDTKLSKHRVEEIIEKYHTKFDPPLILAHDSNEDHWAYWERCPELLKKDERNLSEKDQDNRIDKHLNSTPEITVKAVPNPPATQKDIVIPDVIVVDNNPPEQPIYVNSGTSDVVYYDTHELPSVTSSYVTFSSGTTSTYSPTLVYSYTVTYY